MVFSILILNIQRYWDDNYAQYQLQDRTNKPVAITIYKEHEFNLPCSIGSLQGTIIKKDTIISVIAGFFSPQNDTVEIIQF